MDRFSAVRFRFVAMAAMFTASLPDLAASPAVLAGTPANRLAEEVFQCLLATPIGQSAARPRGVILIAPLD